MATEAKPSDAPNRCDVDDEKSTSKVNGHPEAIDLVSWSDQLSIPERFERTAKYARDPTKYLEEVIGQRALLERRTLLCIPDKIDMDIYGEGEHKAHFESHIARLFGKEHALFFLTGVQAQLSALKIYCQRQHTNRVAWHHTSHLESAEQRAFETLYGLERILLGKEPDILPTVDEIQHVLDLPYDQRPAVILLEIPNRTLGCPTYTFRELQSICAACQKAGVMLHCDGARLWEIEPYYQKTAGKTFSDIAACFDSLYVSFYKALRGVTGAMLICPDELFVLEARMWQRRAGGNALTLLYEVVDCERGFNENIGTFAASWAKMQEVVSAIKAATGHYTNEDGTPIVRFMVDPPTCWQGRIAFQGYTRKELEAARDETLKRTNVSLFPSLSPKKELDKLLDEKRESVAVRHAEAQVDATDKDLHHIREWMMVKKVYLLETRVFVDAYVTFLDVLTSGKS